MSIEDSHRHAGPKSKLRWRVRWRDASGRQRSKSFVSKRSAERFEMERQMSPAELETDLIVEDLAERWLASKASLRPKSVESCRNATNHVLAEFGGMPVASLKSSDVRVWLGGMSGSASLRRQALLALRAMIQMAVDDGHLVGNPCVGIKTPIPARRDPEYMSAPQLLSLAEAAGSGRLMVLTMGTTGVRIGEAAGFQVGDWDPERNRLRVRRTVSKGRVGPPKTHQARDVPVPPSVAVDLVALCSGRPGSSWLFRSPLGHRLDPDNWRRNVFHPAARSIGRGKMDPHELRHTAASLAIASGADVKAVQRMLGHASAAMTLDLYGHLFDQGLQDVAVRMDALLIVRPG